MRRILRKILAGEEDQLGDTSTVSFPSFSTYPILRQCKHADKNRQTALGSKRRRHNHHDSPRRPKEVDLGRPSKTANRLAWVMQKSVMESMMRFPFLLLV
jgi:hypothetical protein